MPEPTRLTFEGTISGCKPIMTKADAYQGGARTGKLELTLTIPQPTPPTKPQIPYNFATGYGADAEWRPRSDFEEEQTLELYDSRRSEYDEEVVRYLEALEGHRSRVISYANLVGLAAVFGNETVNVVITPANQDVLPGFGLDLLPAPGGDQRHA